MAELVDDDVIEHVERREREPPVEREPAARRARAPLRPVVAYVDAADLDAERRRFLLGDHGDELAHRTLRVVSGDSSRVEPEARHLSCTLARDPAAVRLEHLV